MSSSFAAPLPKKALSACQALKLLWAVLANTCRALLSTLLSALRLACGCPAESCEGVEFYEGFVTHARSHEGSHAFKYPVRMAVVDLDAPPVWWQQEPVARLSASEVRVAAGTDGPVRLLTTPSCAGYDQNPIQIYYCHGEDGSCTRGICEVTNTPWNHRVFFAFDLPGAELPKPLHVSPLMDIGQRWWIKATLPSADGFDVWVNVHGAQCPTAQDAKPLLRAHLHLAPSRWSRSRAERASFGELWRYGLQPHRTAFRIYMNAVLLLRKGVKFRSHPSPEYKQRVLEAGVCPSGRIGAGKPWWVDNAGFPWGPMWAGQKAA